MGRTLATALVLILAAGCAQPDRPAEIEEGSGIPPGPRRPPFGPFERASYWFGSDPGPAEQLGALRKIHHPVDGAHVLQWTDTADRCVTAIRELKERDYTNWQVTAHVVARISRLATRDPSAMVRVESQRTLRWFYAWIHPRAAAMGRGPKVEEGDVIEALRDLKVLRELPADARTDARREEMLGAVQVLGSHRWDTGAEGLAKARLAGAHRVVAGLTDGRLASWRADDGVRDALEWSTSRVADQVVYLTFLAALDDPVAFVRSQAVRTLEPIARPEVLLAFARALARERDFVARLTMIEAVGRAGKDRLDAEPFLVPALATALHDPDETIRLAAARALGRVIGGRADADDAAGWQRWWREHAKEYQRP